MFVEPAGDETTVMDAIGVRVHLHSPTRRRYLASVVAPQVWGLASHYPDAEFHLRAGWLGGPHLDLRAAGGDQDIDWRPVAATLAAGSRHYPAMPPTEAAYLRNAAELGRIEGLRPPYPRLRGHGETELIAGRPEDSLGRHRDRGLARMRAPLLATAALDADGALLAAVAAALLTLADTHPRGLRFGTFSLRSHAEAFFHWAGPGADYRGAFTARMEKDGPVLRQVVRDVQSGAGPGPARQWRQAFRECLAELSDQVTEQDLADASPIPVEARKPAESSSFQRAVAASGAIDDPPAWFPAFRLIINLFYQLLPALDVRPVQRFYLCHAVAESVDAVLGETWQDRLAAVEAHLAAAR